MFPTTENLLIANDPQFDRHANQISTLNAIIVCECVQCYGDARYRFVALLLWGIVHQSELLPSWKIVKLCIRGYMGYTASKNWFFLLSYLIL